MLTLESSIFQLFQAILFTIISLSIKYELKNRIPRFFRFWFFTYYFHLFINNQKIDKFSFILLSQLLVWFSLKAKSLDLQSVLWDKTYFIIEFRTYGCLVWFVCIFVLIKKDRFFFIFKIHLSQVGGTLKVYYGQVLSQHYIIMN